MKKISKTLNLIALVVFLASNFMTPLSYVFADEVEAVQSEVNSESQLVPDVSEGGGLSY